MTMPIDKIKELQETAIRNIIGARQALELFGDQAIIYGLPAAANVCSGIQHWLQHALDDLDQIHPDVWVQ